MLPTQEEPMRLLIVLLTSSILSGCVSLPIDPSKMSAEQIKEWVKDKSIAATCATMNTPYGRGIVVHVGVDKSVMIAGAVTVDDQCKIVIQNAPAR